MWNDNALTWFRRYVVSNEYMNVACKFKTMNVLIKYIFDKKKSCIYLWIYIFYKNHLYSG